MRDRGISLYAGKSVNLRTRIGQDSSQRKHQVINDLRRIGISRHASYALWFKRDSEELDAMEATLMRVFRPQRSFAWPVFTERRWTMRPPDLSGLNEDQLRSIPARPGVYMISLSGAGWRAFLRFNERMDKLALAAVIAIGIE